MSNVVLFPKQKKDTPPLTIEQLYQDVESLRREHIEFLLDEILSFAFQRCYEEGFDLTSEECIKSTALIVEAFRAGLHNTVGIPHALHVVAENIFVDDRDTSEDKALEE